MKKDYETILHPAIYNCKATGRERNPCAYCDKRIEKDEDILKLFTSEYKGTKSYSKRFHLKCFFKTLFINFPKMFDENFDGIKPEIVIENLR